MWARGRSGIGQQKIVFPERSIDAAKNVFRLDIVYVTDHKEDDFDPVSDTGHTFIVRRGHPGDKLMLKIAWLMTVRWILLAPSNLGESDKIIDASFRI